MLVVNQKSEDIYEPKGVGYRESLLQKKYTHCHQLGYSHTQAKLFLKTELESANRSNIQNTVHCKLTVLLELKITTEFFFWFAILLVIQPF